MAAFFEYYYSSNSINFLHLSIKSYTSATSFNNSLHLLACFGQVDNIQRLMSATEYNCRALTASAAVVCLGRFPPSGFYLAPLNRCNYGIFSVFLFQRKKPKRLFLYRQRITAM